MEQNLNDKTACLVTAFQSGDVSAFSTLYDMHINLLFNYGCKLTTDKELLKDCIHDVFVKLYTKKAELGIIDNFKSCVWYGYTMNKPSLLPNGLSMPLQVPATIPLFGVWEVKT